MKDLNKKEHISTRIYNIHKTETEICLLLREFKEIQQLKLLMSSLSRTKQEFL